MNMKAVVARTPTALSLLVLSFLFIASCSQLEQAGAQERFVRPTVVPAENLTPAPTPADQRQVAILSLNVISSEDGQVEAVELRQGRIVNSFAPNVLGLAGPWTVELVGQEKIRFGTLDPRRANVYEDREQEEEGEGVPHTTILLPEVSWELVVPLFDKGQDLGVQEINLYDETGRLIFSTPVDREAWLKAGQER